MLLSSLCPLAAGANSNKKSTPIDQLTDGRTEGQLIDLRQLGRKMHHIVVYYEYNLNCS